MIREILLDILHVSTSILRVWNEILCNQRLYFERIKLVSAQFDNLKESLDSLSVSVDQLEANLTEIGSDVDALLERLNSAPAGLSADETQEVAALVEALKVKTAKAVSDSRADADKA